MFPVVGWLHHHVMRGGESMSCVFVSCVLLSVRRNRKEEEGAGESGRERFTEPTTNVV